MMDTVANAFHRLAPGEPGQIHEQDRSQIHQGVSAAYATAPTRRRAAPVIYVAVRTGGTGGK